MELNGNKQIFEEMEKILEKIVEEDGLDKKEGIRILAEELGLDELSAPLFWRALIELLKQKGENGIINKEFIENTLFDIIQKDIDYEAILFQDNDLLLSDFYIACREQEDFWNESIVQLIEKIKELNNIEEIELQKSISNEHNITSETLRNADAANSFQEAEPPVIPYYNVDDKNYCEIRSDNVKEKQTNPNKLQTTQNQNALERKVEDWIRLLMPQYGRRVELEDLDRNFWVIGQSLSAIGSYIFEKSLFSDGIEGILKEIIQLWENILYLWINIALASQKTEKEVQLIFYHLGYSEFDNFTKFNNIPKISCREKFTGITENYKVKNIFELKEQKVYNFPDNFNQNDLKEVDEISRMKILSEQFSNQKLCILPIKRVNNYHKDYFSGEWYEYLYVHTDIEKIGDKYEKDVWRKIRIRECIGQRGGEFITDNLVISPRYDRQVEYNGKTYYRFTPFIFGVHTFQDDTFVYGYPFFDSKNYTLSDDNNQFFYCALRTKPEIDISITQDGKIEVKDFKIKVYDGYSKLICNEDHLIGEYFLINSQIIDDTEDNELILGFRYSQECIDIYSKYKYLPPKNEKLWINNYYSNYLGEIPSWRNNAQNIVSVLDEKMVENNAIFLKIGNFLPVYEDGNYTYAHTQNGRVEQYFMDFTRVQTNSLNNPYGFYSYYNFEKDKVENYLISNDLKMEDSPFNSEPNFISSQTLKQFSNEDKLNRNCIKKISDATVRDFIIAYYAQDFRKDLFWGKSCFFITGIGLLPIQKNLNENDFEWVYSVNALCFVYHFIPNQKYLDYSDKIVDKNYSIAYDACKEIILVKDGEKEIGKIISCGEINGYDSFYDYIDNTYDFKNRMININDDFYEEDSNGNKRKKLELIFNGDKIELQKIENEDSESISYIPIFEEELDAKVIYYDLLNSGYISNRFDVSDVIEASVLQVSQGQIKISQFKENQIQSFSQVENGDIKKIDGDLFENRTNACQKKNLNTSLPFAAGKEEPFNNYFETIINDYNKYTDVDENSSFYPYNYIIGRIEDNIYGFYKKPDLYQDKKHIDSYWYICNNNRMVKDCLIYQTNNGDHRLLLPHPFPYKDLYDSSQICIIDENTAGLIENNYNCYSQNDAMEWITTDNTFGELPDKILIRNGTYNGETIEEVIISKKNFKNFTVKYCDKAAYYYFYKNISQLTGGEISTYPPETDTKNQYKDLIVFHEEGKFILENNETILEVNDQGIEVKSWEDTKTDIEYDKIMNGGKVYYLWNNEIEKKEFWYITINNDMIDRLQSGHYSYSKEDGVKRIIKEEKAYINIVKDYLSSDYTLFNLAEKITEDLINGYTEKELLMSEKYDPIIYISQDDEKISILFYTDGFKI